MAATEISAALFEKHAKLFNKKGLKRRYSSIPARNTEYARILPLGITTKFVFEVVVDKDSYNTVKEFFVGEGFRIIGSKNTVFYEDIIRDYDANPENYDQLKDQIDKVRTDLKELVDTQSDYVELEDNDVKFYIQPYNEKINTICDFVEEEKAKLLELSVKEDITLLLRVVGHTNLVSGFFGFNFYDADKKDEEVVIDYSSNLAVSTDFNEPGKVLVAAYYLTGIAENPDDLELLNTHIFAENLKFKN